ncbi:MAG: hypothetical protein M1816_001299 [Peltula sp. TS41687]|nr:MAG: hypothetical protein M1816_001299 [Peltula sp. TS41687]
MDPLSLSAGIIALLQLTATVTSYLNNVKDASKDRAKCAIEASNVYSLLTNLRYRLEGATSEDPWFIAVRGLSIENGPLDQYKAALEQLMSKLAPADKLRRMGEALTWKFNKSEVEAILQRIERLKVLTQIALEMDHFKLSQAIKSDTTNIKEGITELREGVNFLHQSYDNQSYQNIVDWLSPLNFQARQLDVFKQRQEGTGKWFLESKVYTDWVDGPPSTLWCPGIPGAGKTVLSSIVVDDLQRKHPGDDVAVLCLYCSYQQRIDQTAETLVASLLKQLVQGRGVISDSIESLYEVHRSKGSRPKRTELADALRSEIHSYTRAFIVVDALDECAEDQGIRRDLLGELESLSDIVHLMATSRPHVIIDQHFNGIRELHIHADDKDIEEYVRRRIQQESRLARHVKADPTLEDDMVKMIVANSKGMFLLARLHMDSLVSKHTRREVRKSLVNLPEGLNSTYTEAMERVRGQNEGDRNLAERVLAWITYAKRPLSAVELQHALAIEPGVEIIEDEDLVEIEILISVCVGLVVVDGESGITRLVHYTTQEYFVNQGQGLFPGLEDDIARMCIAYLSLDAFKDGYCRTDDEFKSRRKRYALIEYAARHWGEHAFEREEAVKEMAIRLLLKKTNVRLITQLVYPDPHRDYRKGWSQQFDTKISGLHIAVGLGLKVIVQDLLKMGSNPCKLDRNGRTPLSWAAERGHEAVIKLLLDRDDIDVNSKSQFDRTPLSHAAERGHEAAVKLLLGREDVEADSRDEHDRTPLFYAAQGGHEAVVKLLLGREDVEADSRDEHDRTPLFYAAGGGHEAVVKLLLGREDVEADSRDEHDRTPLFCAARSGHEAVVKLLLGREDVEADSRDKGKRTPLFCAAEGGHEAVVKLLLDRDDIDVNVKSQFDQTPLSHAAESGHEAVVKLLLDRDDIDVNLKAQFNGTPLSHAARSGHETVVKLLLGREDVEADSRDEHDRTPLFCAAEGGHEAVVKLLLGREDVEADSRDEHDRTPLFCAARSGHEAVFKLLLGREDVEADSRDEHDRTPLFCAAGGGHEAVVKLLLDRDDIDVNVKSQFDQTPLSHAVESGHEAVVKLLLDRDDIDVNVKSQFDQTPLSHAAESGHEAVVKLLLGRNDVEADSKDEHDRTPLFYAANWGHEAVFKLLLGRDDVEAGSKDEHDRTPLFYAAGGGHEAVVKLLLGREDVEADSKDEHDRTPLFYAANWGHEAVFKLLLGRDDVEAGSKDEHDRTSLFYAAGGGHEAVVKLLLGRDDIDACSEDKHGHTPLWWAIAERNSVTKRARYGWKRRSRKYEAVIELLQDQMLQRYSVDKV